MGELLGYARVSTTVQDAAMQHDALSAAGCWRTWTDRLGRSLPHLVETVRQLEERDVGFRSLQEAIDTTTPGGRLVFHIFASLAEFERDLIRERTRAGLDAARRRGRVGGRKTVLTPAKERQARKMLAEGASKEEIADVVGVSVSTLYRRLRPEGEDVRG